MKVIKLDLKTPGIFLDREGGSFEGTLEFEIKKGDRWVNVNSGSSDVKILSKPVTPGTVSTATALATKKLKVPERSEGTLEYYAIVADDATFEYRIVANPCPDCGDFFIDINEESRLLSGSKWGPIQVGEGRI